MGGKSLTIQSKAWCSQIGRMAGMVGIAVRKVYERGFVCGGRMQLFTYVGKGLRNEV